MEYPTSTSQGQNVIVNAIIVTNGEHVVIFLVMQAKIVKKGDVMDVWIEERAEM